MRWAAPRSLRILPVVIREQSTFRLCWDAAVLLLILYSCVLIPYQLVFLQSQQMVNNGVLHLISLVFLCDITLNFLTTHRQAGTEILDPAANRRHYMRGMFAIDLLANFPLGCPYQKLHP